ncbi:iron (metal) dependent repressor, DtxR family [Spirosomataceae bacterium TFI 002]|nr:iron (metal) dependent repressor, DtxR family [Spirosomataceae bacterium TFI 002]
MTSFTEENYLKAIYHLSHSKGGGSVSTSELAESTQTRAASVSDMLRKLSDKAFINYIKYQGVTLTDSGLQIALKVIRKHRLWEVFLVEKLGFGWGEIHEIAEQLEHIDAVELTSRLDDFLGNPKFDPHGDPIPDVKGNLPKVDSIKLSEATIGNTLVVVGVLEDSTSFLQHLDKIDFKLGLSLKVLEISSFDKSVEVELTERGNRKRLSFEVARNILVNIH